MPNPHSDKIQKSPHEKVVSSTTWRSTRGFIEEKMFKQILEVWLGPGNVERELQKESIGKMLKMGWPEDCKLFQHIALAARVVEGTATRPCGWGWIRISRIRLEEALDIQSGMASNIKFRWGTEECNILDILSLTLLHPSPLHFPGHYTNSNCQNLVSLSQPM